MRRNMVFHMKLGTRDRAAPERSGGGTDPDEGSRNAHRTTGGDRLGRMPVESDERCMHVCLLARAYVYVHARKYT